MLPQVTDRLRPPRRGIIRLGVREDTTTRAGKSTTLPKEVPFFVLPEPLKSAHAAAHEGEERPTTLSVLLPFDDPDQLLRASYTRYDGKLCTLSCDGRTYWKWPKDGQKTSGTCCRSTLGSVEWPDGPGSCGAHALARFSVIPLDGPMGVYQIPIGGEQRIADLYADLLVARAIYRRLTDVVFTLARVPTEVQIIAPSGGRMARTGWPVRLFTQQDTRQALTASGRAPAALPQGQIVDAQAIEDDEGALEAPWDISACYAVVQRLGGHAEDYTHYLRKKYTPHTEEDLTVEQIHEQETITRKAQDDAIYAQRFLAHLKNGAAR